MRFTYRAVRHVRGDIHLKTIVTPERIESIQWNFGKIFFDSFTNNLGLKKKFDFLSHLNLFPP